MNETNFATYDSYFCSTNYQVSIDNALMDYDMLPQNYMNNASCDLVVQPSSVEQRHHTTGQTNVFPFLSHTREEQDRIKDTTTNLRVSNGSGVSAGSAQNAFANIPFVQIHTTGVPQRTSYGNVFRRNISRQEEIKSEPIKSESAEAAAKERTNATPTPPRAPSATQQTESDDTRTITTPKCQNDSMKAIEPPEVNKECADRVEHESLSKVPCVIYKCSICPYISLKESERSDHQRSHMEAETQTGMRTEIKCPGCCNIFFVLQSLEVHLKLDHLMSEVDVPKLLQSMAKIKPNESQNTIKESTEVANMDQPPRKSRIYLKNVECLREPNRQPIEQTENQLSGNNNNNNKSDAQNQNLKAPKQKISIKSVDVLREPALLRRDYERENENFNIYLGDNDQITTLNIPTTPSAYDEYNPNADSLLINTSNLNNNDTNLVNSNVDCNSVALEKPRKPKIYVKSVESFNLMPLDPMHSTNTDFMGDHNTAQQSYDPNLVHLPFIYESNQTITAAAVNSNVTFINNSHTENMDGYHVVNNSNSNGNNYILENPLYVTNVEDININEDLGQVDSSILITEPTPTPPPHNLNVEEVVRFTDKSFPNSQEHQRGTLHLRTVDELNLMNDNEIQHNSNIADLLHFHTNKSLPPNQEQRGTLHLRTVDELNLMNENEVQHLIAPNLDNNHNSSDETMQPHNINMNEGNLIGDTIYDTEAFKFHDLDSQMANDWPETYEDLAEDINGIITDVTQNHSGVENAVYSIENNQKNSCSNFDIETPQVSLITIRDIEELTGGTAMIDPQFTNYVNDSISPGPTVEKPLTPTSEQIENINITPDVSILNGTTVNNVESSENLKRELSNATPETEDSAASKMSCDTVTSIINVETVTSTLPSPTAEVSDSSLPQSSSKCSIAQSFSNPCGKKLAEVDLSDTLPSSEPFQSVTELPHSPSQLSTGNGNDRLIKNRISNTDFPKYRHTNTSAMTTKATELPPLVPVTNLLNSPSSSISSQNQSSPASLPTNDIPIPPLVPVPPLIKINKSIAIAPNTAASGLVPLSQEKSPTQQYTPLEKGRIYVANNLMEPTKKPVAVSATSGTSIRGRPFGSNRTRIAQQVKQQQGIAADDMFLKCSLKGCAFRFKKNETLEYHIKCHDITSSNPQATICPECKSTEFNNWNTLHTHLWRAHQIDMELYKCELCDFKTPIFSRLVNTHAKIHFDDRNYKCEQCGKGFKNSKQLKNHRRWHRTSNATAPTTSELSPLRSKIHQCADCGSTFSHQKTLKDHCCKNTETSLKCDICQKEMSAKSSMKLHMLTHMSGEEKRFKCQQCDYSTNDHNAFRRHRMGHENKKMYECQFCDYKSVQSITYQKHIRHKHPDKEDEVIHKCYDCPFTTINRSLLFVHQAKHHKQQITQDETELSDHKESLHSDNIMEKSLACATSDVQKSKIKVKSNLFTL